MVGCLRRALLRSMRGRPRFALWRWIQWWWVISDEYHSDPREEGLGLYARKALAQLLPPQARRMDVCVTEHDTAVGTQSSRARHNVAWNNTSMTPWCPRLWPCATWLDALACLSFINRGRHIQLLLGVEAGGMSASYNQFWPPPLKVSSAKLGQDLLN